MTRPPEMPQPNALALVPLMRRAMTELSAVLPPGFRLAIAITHPDDLGGESDIVLRTGGAGMFAAAFQRALERELARAATTKETTP